MIAITGGAGFIGSHAVREFLATGHRVRVLDNLSSGSKANLPESDGLELIEGSILDESALQAAFLGCDAVVHLAAEPSVQKSVEHPIETHEINFIGTMKVANAARLQNVRRLVYASSAAVFDSSAPLPLTERSATAPISPYGVDKLSGEYYLGCLAALDSLSTVALRFFNVFGERQSPKSPYSGVISLFLDGIGSGRQITIFGDGSQTRDFVYAGDVARALRLATESELSGHHVINIGTGRETSLLDLVGAIESTLGRRANVRHADSRPGDIVRSVCDPAKARQLIGFQPQVGIEEGLRATADLAPTT